MYPNSYNTTPRDAIHQQLETVNRLLVETRDSLTQLKDLFNTHLAGPTLISHRNHFTSLMLINDHLEASLSANMHLSVELRGRLFELEAKLREDERHRANTAGVYNGLSSKEEWPNLVGKKVDGAIDRLAAEDIARRNMGGALR